MIVNGFVLCIPLKRCPDWTVVSWACVLRFETFTFCIPFFLFFFLLCSYGNNHAIDHVLFISDLHVHLHASSVAITVSLHYHILYM